MKNHILTYFMRSKLLYCPDNWTEFCAAYVLVKTTLRDRRISEEKVAEGLTSSRSEEKVPEEITGSRSTSTA